MKQKLFLATLAAAIAVPSVVAAVPTETNAAKITFSDVSKKHPNYKEISEMVSLGVIKGTNGKFNPGANITRSQAALMLDRVMVAKKLPYSVTVSPKLTDVTAKNSNRDTIVKLLRGGIMWTEGSKFNPSRPMTRGEMGMSIHNAFSLDDLKLGEEPTKHPFTDVSDELMDYYVSRLYEAGITTGSGNRFNEKKPVTRLQFVLFLHRAIAYYEQQLAKQPQRTELQLTDSYEDAAHIIRKWPIVQVGSSSSKILNKDLWASDSIRNVLVQGIPTLTNNMPKTVINGVAGYLLLSQEGWKKNYVGIYGQVSLYTRDEDITISVDLSYDSSWTMLSYILPTLAPNIDVDDFISTIKRESASLETLSGKSVVLNSGQEIDIHKQEIALSITLPSALTK